MEILPEDSRNSQDDMPVFYLGKNGLLHLGYPVINIDFGTTQAEPRLTAKGNSFDVAAATAIFSIAV